MDIVIFLLVFVVVSSLILVIVLLSKLIKLNKKSIQKIDKIIYAVCEKIL